MKNMKSIIVIIIIIIIIIINNNNMCPCNCYYYVHYLLMNSTGFAVTVVVSFTPFMFSFVFNLCHCNIQNQDSFSHRPDTSCNR